MCKNKLFQSSGMENELYAKFRDANNNLTYKVLILKTTALIPPKSFLNESLIMTKCFRTFHMAL